MAYKRIKKYTKTNYHTRTKTNVNVLKGGQQIRVDLPPNSLVDLSTFLMSFTAWCDTGASPAGGETAYTQCRFLPRNTASLIENLEVQSMDNHASIVSITIIFTISFMIILKDKMA